MINMISKFKMKTESSTAFQSPSPLTSQPAGYNLLICFKIYIYIYIHIALKYFSWLLKLLILVPVEILFQ